MALAGGRKVRAHHTFYLLTPLPLYIRVDLLLFSFVSHILECDVEEKQLVVLVSMTRSHLKA